MTEIANLPLSLIGCDVNKAKIVVHDSRDGRTRIVYNIRKDLLAFARQLDPACLVICEATGGYETELLDAMLEAGIPAHRADARRVKSFIRSHGTPAFRAIREKPRRNARHWPRPIGSTPPPWPNSAASAMPAWRAGQRPTSTATS